MSKQPGPSLIHVPTLFSIVEPGVYRCASPTAPQVPFLASLELKTILSLTPEYPNKQLSAHIKASSIDFIPLGTTLWSPLSDWKPIRDEVVKAALEILMDTRNHPVLLIDPLGIHQTGCVVGALRMLQGWNFASILIEYRSHAGPGRHRIADEQYIELFDPDLINLPPPEYRASWLMVDDDDTDTDYSIDEDMMIKATGVKTGDELGREMPTDSQEANDTISTGEHVGVG